MNAAHGDRTLLDDARNARGMETNVAAENRESTFHRFILQDIFSRK